MTGSDKVRVLFFGQLRQRLNCARLEWAMSQPMAINDLKQALLQQGPDWQPLAEGQVLSALNQTLTGGEQQVKPGDEVAFFPPVTGG